MTITYNILATNTNHYPFGMIMPGRHAIQGEYRYGVNGKEIDDEVKKEGY